MRIDNLLIFKIAVLPFMVMKIELITIYYIKPSMLEFFFSWLDILQATISLDDPSLENVANQSRNVGDLAMKE